MIVIKYSYDRTGTWACLAQTWKGKVIGFGTSREESLADAERQVVE